MGISVKDRSLPNSQGIITQGSPKITTDVNGMNGARLPAAAQIPCSNHYMEMATVEGEPVPATAVGAASDPGTVAEGPQSEGASAYKVQKSAPEPVTAEPRSPRYTTGAADDAAETAVTGRLPITAFPNGGGEKRGPAIWNPSNGRRGAY
jgi:hypothetical protein